MKSRVKIRFKSGFELPITCDEITINTNTMTGEITGYNIKGITDNNPLFLRVEDIECIFQEMSDETN